MNTAATFTHTVSHNGRTEHCTPETFHAVCESFLQGGVEWRDLNIVAVNKVATVAIVSRGDTIATPAPVAAAPGDLVVSATGAARALRDEKTAFASGFAPEPPIYKIGTIVNETGVDNARASQVAHDAKPFASAACALLQRRVEAEDRVDVDGVVLSALRMSKRGLLVLPDAHRMQVGTRAFGQLFNRFPCASGAAYLGDCTDELRAINFNHWAVATTASAPVAVKLRTRNGRNGVRVVYAAVGQNYPTFDVDKIAEALGQAFPADTRAVVDYDGTRVRVEGAWHTDINPTDFVAGEIFKACVLVRSDDTGGGSIRVQSAIWRNLCLNLIVLDKAIGVDIRIAHKGSVADLARKFRRAFAEALRSTAGFQTAWSKAFNERDAVLVSRSQGTTSDELHGMPIESVLQGLFNGIIERDLVPVRGRAKVVVPKLLEMHRQDEAAAAYGVSRASIVNAFTRYAHVVESDPFAADEIRAGAGSLLSTSRGREPAPLPYLALT